MNPSQNRRIFSIALQPAAGSRFQPTGFPDIGAALFDRPHRRDDGSVTWEPALLVESAQSMANHLEATAWDDGTEQPVEVLRGLPYVRVSTPDGEYLTSSRVEAHRLASAFIKDSEFNGTDMKTVIRERLNLRDDRPLVPREIAAAVFALDPMCLVHGVFFAEAASVWPGQPKIARVTTGAVEAHDVRRADSGGVKKDHVRHSLGDAVGGTAEGYGTVPFHRTEWTAAEIVATFNIDLAQIRSYGLGEHASALLETIALWELRALLGDGAMRLRTACDLLPIEAEIMATDGTPLPSRGDLEAEIKAGIDRVADLLPSGGGPIEVTWAGGKAKSAKAKS